MLRNKLVTRPDGRSLKVNWLLVFIPAILLIFVIGLSSWVIKFFVNSSTAEKSQPAQIIKISEPFSAKFYFNDEFGTKIFSETVIKTIEAATSRVEIAVFSMNDQSIRDALYRAADRGVKVSLILSDRRESGHDAVFGPLPTNVSRLDLATKEDGSNGYMHHKFMIVDRGLPSAKLFFGSYNFTYLQEKHDPSFLMETSRPELVNIFGEEFERLLSGKHSQKKLSGSNPFAARVEYPEGFLDIWFGPDFQRTGLKYRMLDLIRSADSNVKVMIWNLTDNDLASVLAFKAERMAVSIITDDTNFMTEDSAFKNILAEKKKKTLDNLEIITDEKRNNEIRIKFNSNFNSFLHHHLLIVDDKLVVFGTNNWGSGGFFKNDESVVISNIPEVVSAFQGTFKRNYNINK